MKLLPFGIPSFIKIALLSILVSTGYSGQGNACADFLLPGEMPKINAAQLGQYRDKLLNQINEITTAANKAHLAPNFAKIIEPKLAAAHSLEDLITVAAQEREAIKTLRSIMDSMAPTLTRELFPAYLQQWQEAYIARLASAWQENGFNWEVISFPVSPEVNQPALRFSFDPTQDLSYVIQAEIKIAPAQNTIQLLKQIKAYWEKYNLPSTKISLVYTNLSNLDFAFSTHPDPAWAYKLDFAKALRNQWLEKNTLLLGEDAFSNLARGKVDLAQLFIKYISMGRTWAIHGPINEVTVPESDRIVLSFYEVASPLEALRIAYPLLRNNSLSKTAVDLMDDPLIKQYYEEIKTNMAVINQHLAMIGKRLRKTIFEPNTYRFLNISKVAFADDIRLKALTKSLRDYYYLVIVDYSAAENSLHDKIEDKNIPVYRLTYPIFVTAENERELQNIEKKFSKNPRQLDTELKRYFYRAGICNISDDSNANFSKVMWNTLAPKSNALTPLFFKTWDLYRASWPITKGVPYWEIE